MLRNQLVLIQVKYVLLVIEEQYISLYSLVREMYINNQNKAYLYKVSMLKVECAMYILSEKWVSKNYQFHIFHTCNKIPGSKDGQKSTK